MPSFLIREKCLKALNLGLLSTLATGDHVYFPQLHLTNKRTRYSFLGNSAIALGLTFQDNYHFIHYPFV